MVLLEWLVVAQAVAEAQSDATDRRMLCAPMLSSLCLGLRADVGVSVVCRAQLLVALLGKDANDSTRQQTLGAQTTPQPKRPAETSDASEDIRLG